MYIFTMMWDEALLLATVEQMRSHGGDLTQIEVKRGSGGVPNLATTLSAFGNLTDGGTIIVGLDEHQGFATVGVSDPAAVQHAIAAQARTAVDPPLAVAFSTIDVNGKSIVVAQVAGVPASVRPCRAGGRAYLRQADGDYVMSPQEEQQLLAMRDRPRFDATPVAGAGLNDLDARLLAQYVFSVRDGSRRLREVDETTLLRRRGILDADSDCVTLAGLYALGDYPQQFTPSLAITAAVVSPPGSPDRLMDLAHFDGPIPDLLDSSMQWLRRNLRTGIRVQPDGHNVDHPEFPLPALRELIANALVHRDLSPHAQSKRVEIRLRPDRLVIDSPGGLWGLSRELLGKPGGKSAVNEHLYDICRLIKIPGGGRVIEGEGGGIGEAQRALAEWPADPPQFIDRAVGFTVVLMRPDVQQPPIVPTGTPVAALSGDPASRILAVLGGGELDRGAIGDRAGLTFAQTKYALGKLTRAGKVTMSGGVGSHHTTYALSNPRDVEND